MKFGHNGEAVKELQQALLEQGYALPIYGDDGDFGNETMAALKQYTEDHKIEWSSDDIPAEVFENLDLDGRLDVDVPEVPTSHLDVDVIDMRSQQTDPPAMARKFKRYMGKVVKRPLSSVTGITIHQTAVKYDVAQYQLNAVGGDRRLALARRALDVACHVMAFHDGFVVWTNPLSWYVYHGNGFNGFELGIEIDGNYPGLIGGETWNGKKPTEVTDQVINAARKGIELLTVKGRELGMPIEYIHAHRQSSATRRSDPGQELWQRVVLDYAVPVLGLRTEPARVLRGRNGDGRPIPIEWDPNGVGKY